MKKLLIFFLTVIVAFTITAPAYAEGVTAGGTKNVDVAIINGNAPITVETVYSVEINFSEALYAESTYFVWKVNVEGETITWNPETHTYYTTSGKKMVWSVPNPLEEALTVTNHSNASVNIEVGYEKMIHVAEPNPDVGLPDDPTQPDGNGNIFVLVPEYVDDTFGVGFKLRGTGAEGSVKTTLRAADVVAPGNPEAADKEVVAIVPFGEPTVPDKTYGTAVTVTTVVVRITSAE